ncbi:hypothetical protein PILCRDRAFT_814392 [Piloderma croceum F 1598]|uniref:Uncharacterized protein n=1 Tax=Piloderma croceum (strain F 1598) TaxID=765440 RepID=A0A0C3FVJ3_PILCF|nr:hypothetical protein PILCRDRAFT_814392 [Piloderma croceum F 1598]
MTLLQRENKPAIGFINDCELMDAVMVMKNGATGAMLRSSAALDQKHQEIESSGSAL